MPGGIDGAAPQEKFKTTAFVDQQTAAGAVLSEQRTVGPVVYALLLTPAPATAPRALRRLTRLRRRRARLR